MLTGMMQKVLPINTIDQTDKNKKDKDVLIF